MLHDCSRSGTYMRTRTCVRARVRGAGGGVGGHVQHAGSGKHTVSVCNDVAGARGGGHENAQGAVRGPGGLVQDAGRGKHAVGVCDDVAGARGRGVEGAEGAGGGVGGPASVPSQNCRSKPCRSIFKSSLSFSCSHASLRCWFIVTTLRLIL
jgi:hypothetical protein